MARQALFGSQEFISASNKHLEEKGLVYVSSVECKLLDSLADTDKGATEQSVVNDIIRVVTYGRFIYIRM